MKKVLGVISVLGLGWFVYSGFLFATENIVVTQVQGNCIVNKSGQYDRYAHDIKKDDVLVTYHEGTLDFAMKDFVAIRILPHSECKILRLDGNNIKLQIVKGNAIFSLKDQARNRKFAVETPTAVASARGTQFWGRVDSDKFKNSRTTFAVREGTVDIMIKSTGETHSIGKGEAIEIPYDAAGTNVTFRLATTAEMNAMAQASDIRT